ncbi:aromatic ring-hydroxylating dioxygenase subunit alpha [Myxacorys almedinensis]|uniref:Rieske 2Fe-2S domain-containing protein n=1 Tax=Myxacorys almedinensis A TaxID=2690445 RepID=A0A8J7Z836_9CYAN|nr:aromatic ring-hydroxylating dioxygenase subunit alpha [Myxacorys almedinensis]NDJ19661.1 Rieske 2Fe-2S domain-containing protein [Myxacorys almedinensis A]
MVNTVQNSTVQNSTVEAETVQTETGEKKIYPRGCTFEASDWDVLASFWYPIAFSHEVNQHPISATLLDQRLVIWRTSAGLSVANDICLHRGVPLSMGSLKGDQLVCKYHGFHYSAEGRCVLIPADPTASIPAKLCLKTYPVREAYGLVWTSLTGSDRSEPREANRTLPDFHEWDNPDYQQILPDAVNLNAASGRQMEGFLDVAHFAWVHTNSFGDSNNPLVPRYEVKKTPNGILAEYLSTVSNFPKAMQHRAPADFEWLRIFEVFFPFTARLTVHFPDDGRLCILNAASPISARQTRVFCPICRNFDKDSPLEPIYEFNYQVFAEDKEVVEAQYPEDLPLDLRAESHIRADQTSIAYRKGLGALGLGKTYTA